MICLFLSCFIMYLSFSCLVRIEKTGHEACPDKGTLRLTTETGKGMWESHQITVFQVLGQEKALTGIPPTLVWVYLIIRMYCPWMVFSDAGAASCALIILYQFAL